MSTVFIGAVNISETAASAILMAGLKIKLLISLKIKAGQKKHSDFFDFYDFSRKNNIPLLQTNDINSSKCKRIIKKFGCNNIVNQLSDIYQSNVLPIKDKIKRLNNTKVQMVLVKKVW